MRHDSTPAPLDESFAYEMIDRALEAYNAHDAERFAELWTEDVIYHHSAAPTAMRGHAQMRAFYSDSWKAFPDGRAELHDGPFLHPRAPRFSNVWRWTGTHTGPLERMGLAGASASSCSPSRSSKSATGSHRASASSRTWPTSWRSSGSSPRQAAAPSV